MPRFFLGYRLGAPLEKYRQNVRAHLVQEYNIRPIGGHTEAHVTVKSPFELPVLEASRVPGRIATMLARKAIKPLKAWLGPVSVFPQGVVHLPVQTPGSTDSDEIPAMMRYIISELGLKPTGYETLKPHMTLARVSPEHAGLACGCADALPLPGREVSLDTLVWWRKSDEGTSEEAVIDLTYSPMRA